MESVEEKLRNTENTLDIDMDEKIKLLHTIVNDNLDGIGSSTLKIERTDAALLDEITREVVGLQEKGGMLKFDTTYGRINDCQGYNYMDMSTGEKLVSVIYVSVFYSELLIQLALDADTLQIYEYQCNVYSEYTEELNNDEKEKIILNFINYYDLDTEVFEQCYELEKLPFVLMLSRDQNMGTDAISM